MAFFRKRLRLPADHYRGRIISFVTVGTERRAPFFAEQSTGNWLVQRLLESAAHQGFSLHAYCVMPDHVHFLCEGTSDTCDLARFVNTFKQRAAFEFQKRKGTRLWQMRYYDHILRPKEVIEDVACYIWWNPVRKGLCRSPELYPLSGSRTIEWIKRNIPETEWTPPWKRQEVG